MSPDPSNPLVTMRGIRRAFPGVVALDGVDFTLRTGEVHALMGENGAGKSTLVKVLTGVHPRDAGDVRLNGTVINPSSPQEAQGLGISTVYQEVSLIRASRWPRTSCWAGSLGVWAASTGRQ